VSLLWLLWLRSCCSCFPLWRSRLDGHESYHPLPLLNPGGGMASPRLGRWRPALSRSARPEFALVL